MRIKIEGNSGFYLAFMIFLSINSGLSEMIRRSGKEIHTDQHIES